MIQISGQGNRDDLGRGCRAGGFAVLRNMPRSSGGWVFCSAIRLRDPCGAVPSGGLDIGDVQNLIALFAAGGADLDAVAFFLADQGAGQR